MKKRIIGLITIVSFIAVLCGCGKGAPQYSETDSDIIGVDSNTSVDTSSGDELVFADFVGEYPDNPIPIMTLSEEEIRQVINAQPNFHCSENMYINIPESASVYEYRSYNVITPQRKLAYSNDQFKKDFETTFKYFFPDKEMNADYYMYSNLLGYDHEKGGYITEEGYVKDTETMTAR